MTTMQDIRYEKIKDKIPAGYFLIKEYQKWGQCFTFKNAEGNILFYENGKFMEKKELFKYLTENWRPVRQDEIFYFMNQMENELNG